MSETRTVSGHFAPNVILQQSDDINRRIVDSCEDCLKILDLGGRIQYVNSAGVAHMDLGDPSEMLGRDWLEFWEAEDRDAARAALESARAGGRGTFQGLSRTATGRFKWWDVAVTPIASADGSIAQLLAVARDLTARQKEEAFRTGQHRALEMIATGAPLGDVLTSLVFLLERQCDGMQGSILLLDETRQSIQRGAAPSLPAAFSDAIDGLPIGPRAGSCGTAMYLGKPVIVTDIERDPLWEDYRDLAREFGFCACWSTPILSPQRKVLGTFAIYAGEPRTPTGEELRLLDVSASIAGIAIERERAHRALHESEQRNRAIIRAIPDWIFVTSASGVFLDYHAKDPERLIAPPASFMGRSVREMLPPALAETLSGAFARVVASDEPEKVEYSLGENEGERFYEAMVVRCDEDRVLSIVRDITDRRRAELDAAAQRQELVHLNRVAMLGELTGALAHELSQPLAAVLSSAQAARRFLDRTPADVEEVSEAIDDIIRNDQRAGAVIERLRTLLKKGTPVRQRLDLGEITREALELVRSDLQVRRISVATRFAPALPAVIGDRIQLQQVILNLVHNACEAMAGIESGDRTLIVDTATRGESVEVSICDNGVGIPPNQLDAVFEPFVTFREHGLGLGLAISRSIMGAHGGRITAENNPDGGATFRCLLPAAFGGA
jgi:PAS domain S-box-containing protein